MPRRAIVRVLASAVLATTVSSLPGFLLGGLAVIMRAELDFSETQLGLAVAVFFGTSALCSAPAGWAAERRGARGTVLAGTALAGASLGGIALLVRSYPALLVGLAVGGVGNAAVQLGVNRSLAVAVPRRLRGLGFGVKQAAVPLATLLAGLAVPVVALTVGWRWAYAGAALLACGVPLLAPVDAGRRLRGPVREGDPAVRPLIVLALGGGLAAAAVNSIGAFAVESAVAGGMSPARAGVLFATGSALGVATRVGQGAWADRRAGNHLAVVIVSLALGAIGIALLADPSTVALGVMVAFVAGWGWVGLFHFAVVQLNPRAPAAATGITSTGLFVGNAIGPLAFGALVEQASYPTAWLAAAALMLAASGLLWWGRALLRQDPAVARALSPLPQR